MGGGLEIIATIGEADVTREEVRAWEFDRARQVAARLGVDPGGDLGALRGRLLTRKLELGHAGVERPAPPPGHQEVRAGRPPTTRRTDSVPAAMGWPPRIGEPLPRAADAWCVEEKWTAWILADQGHRSEWLTVLGVEPGEWERAWAALREAVKEATIESVRLPEAGGVGCGVTADLAIGGRSAPVTSAWHYAMRGAAPRLVTAYPTPYNRVHGGDA